MHIVIDARMVGEQLHGISRYTLSLLKTFTTLHTKHRFTLLVTHDLLKKILPFEVKRMTSPWLSIGEQLELPMVLKKLSPDLFHSPSFCMSWTCPVPYLMTLHDMNHLAFKKEQKISSLLYYKIILKQAVKKARKIITVSQFSKKEILKFFDIFPDKIKVIYNGVDASFFSPAASPQIEKVRHKYHLPCSFMLYCGNSKKHKNLDRVIQAFQTFSNQTDLAILGVSSPSIRKKYLHYLSNVEEKDLPAIYQMSQAVLFPSLYEGFGFPAVEALAMGKCLITSNSSSLPELVEHAALQVDPTSVEAIRTAITQARLLPASYINTDGIKQAQKFSWLHAAQQTLEIYENCRRS